DSRMLVFDPMGGLIVADDGGIYRFDRTGNGAWTSLIGDLGDREVNAVAYDPINDRVLVGTQDTGAFEQVQQGNQLVWRHTTGGDGGNEAVGWETDAAGKVHVYHYAVGNTLGGLVRTEFDSAGNQVGNKADIGDELPAVDQNGDGFQLYPIAVNA